MKSNKRWLPVLAIAMGAVALGMAPATRADSHEEEIPFADAIVFFELNNTDGDLGIHALIDGDPWKMLAIETPNERVNLRIRLSGSMRQQGLTELFFESAEPTFDELAPEEFFERFPEGEYEVEGLSVEGEEMESISMVTHLIPAPAGNLAVNGTLLPEDCDAELPSIAEPFLVTWDEVTLSHPELGRTGEPIEVVKYELVLEREDPTPLKYGIDLPPDVTSVQLPAGLAASGEEFKIEVLVREASGNQTAVESCFEVD